MFERERGETSLCLCVFGSVSVFLCMWECVLIPPCAFTWLSACQWNRVSLKEVNLEDALSSWPRAYRSPLPTASHHLRPLQQSKQAASSSLLNPPLSSQAHVCHSLMEYLTTDVYLNVNAHTGPTALCWFTSSLLLSRPSGTQNTVSENDPSGWILISLWTSHYIFKRNNISSALFIIVRGSQLDKCGSRTVRSSNTAAVRCLHSEQT